MRLIKVHTHTLLLLLLLLGSNGMLALISPPRARP
jgi:hypothetical protein